MDTYIAFNAGCDTWTVEKFDSSIYWHYDEYQGTKEECIKEANLQNNTTNTPHYPSAPYGSIWDY